jgi:hypothetical protein
MSELSGTITSAVTDISPAIVQNNNTNYTTTDVVMTEDNNVNDSTVEFKESDQVKRSNPRTKKSASAASTPSRASTRERKPVKELYNASQVVSSSKAPESSEEFSIEGSGLRLGSIDNVEKRLSLTKATEPEIIKLYAALFNRRSTKDVAKKHIREFSGFTVQEQEEIAREKLNSADLHIIKLIAGLLDVTTSGSKSDLIDRIVKFLWSATTSRLSPLLS